jgi:hypothetical protein
MMDERKIYNRSQNKPVDNTATDYHRNNRIDLHPPPLYHRQGFCHCSVINTKDFSFVHHIITRQYLIITNVLETIKYHVQYKMDLDLI